MIPKFELDGERLTLAELSARYGIPKRTLYGRIVMNGMSVKDAVSVRKMPHGRRIPMTFNGEDVTFAELSKRANISMDTLYYRIRRKGLTPEEAVAMPKRQRKTAAQSRREKCTYPDCDRCPFPDCVV